MYTSYHNGLPLNLFLQLVLEVPYNRNASQKGNGLQDWFRFFKHFFRVQILPAQVKFIDLILPIMVWEETKCYIMSHAAKYQSGYCRMFDPIVQGGENEYLFSLLFYLSALLFHLCRPFQEILIQRLRENRLFNDLSLMADQPINLCCKRHLPKNRFDDVFCNCFWFFIVIFWHFILYLISHSKAGRTGPKP